MLTEEQKRQERDAWRIAMFILVEDMFREAGLEIENPSRLEQEPDQWLIQARVADCSDFQSGVTEIMELVHEEGGITKACNCFMTATGPNCNIIKVGAWFI